MGIEVTNEKTGKSRSFSGHSWALYLQIAEYYGWKPRGTKKPKGYGFFRKWPGNYDTNDGQIVVYGDAKRLGMIIAHSLTDPNFDHNAAAFEKRMKEHLLAKVGPELLATFQASFDKAGYKEFGEFCSIGAFRIE